MDRDALRLLANSSIRRLYAIRSGPHRADARHNIRAWVRTLRALEGAAHA